MDIVAPFEIICLNGDTISWTDQMPPGDIFHRFPTAALWSAEGGWGNMVFQSFQKPGFSIWYSRYRMHHRRNFMARGDVPLLEFSLQLDNSASYTANPFNHQTVRSSQFNIFYLPYMENRANFERNQLTTTLDIHCTGSYLENLAQHFPGVILPFLEHANCGKAARVFNEPLLATTFMLSVANHILYLLKANPVNDFLLEQSVEILISHGLACKFEMDLKSKPISLEDVGRIHAIRHALLSDFSTLPNLSHLARRYHMSLPSLKTSFKKTMSMSPYNYWMVHRLECGRDKLLLTGDSISSIAYDLAFSNPAAFTKAFKKHFGMAPSELREEKSRG